MKRFCTTSWRTDSDWTGNLDSWFPSHWSWGGDDFYLTIDRDFWSILFGFLDPTKNYWITEKSNKKFDKKFEISVVTITCEGLPFCLLGEVYISRTSPHRRPFSIGSNFESKILVN